MTTGEPSVPEPQPEKLRVVRKPSLLDALIPVGGLVILLALSYYLFGADASQGPNQIALTFAGFLAAIIALQERNALGEHP